MDEAPGTRPGLIPQAHGGALTPAWTREQAIENGKKGNKKGKGYSLRTALARRLKAKRPDGSRPWDDALTAFVEKLLEGDVRALELALNHVDGPLIQEKRVLTANAKDILEGLAIRADGDRRGQGELPPIAVESESVQPIQAPDRSESS